ncbi:MAG: gamma-glutamyltransferase, partial [Hyphomonas sp.]|nr:gamma-glutamyltransferase [Hyphomonas sp.]
MHWPHTGIPHRPPAIGRTAAVSSAHQLASTAGIEMLRLGGNAVDAGVAMAASIGVVEPYGSGLGGSGIMLIAEPGCRQPIVLDFVGPAPARANLDAFAEPGSKDDGIRATIVPGAVAGWFEALRRYGRLPLETVLKPAIELARNGSPMSAYLHRYFHRYEDRLRATETTCRIFLPHGRIPEIGEFIIQEDLARSLEKIAADGPDAFYKGDIADELVSYSQANGGLLSREDLASYKPDWSEPLSGTFGRYTIFVPPPPSSALQWLLSLNMLEAAGVESYEPESAEYVHLLAEVFKLAIADRNRWICEPGQAWRHLVEKSYAIGRLRDFDPAAANAVEPERIEPSRSPSWISPGRPTP